MPTVEERLQHVTLKVKRAKEHVASLERELHAFIESGPYKVAHSRDPNTRQLIYYVEEAEPVPECLPLIAGDAIQNLMSALDHLAYQIVCNDTGDNPPNPNWIYFPIANDDVSYEAKKRGKMDGARQETFDAIDSLKPYKGGNDLLWVLYRLNNIEKHRLLLTVGSQAAGINLGQLMAGIPISSTMPAELVAALESMNVFINPADKGFPLTAGFKLYIGAIDQMPNPKQQFRFDVVLNESGIIEGKSLLQTVNQLIALVDSVVISLTPLIQTSPEVPESNRFE
jgi:hypothetical protein